VRRVHERKTEIEIGDSIMRSLVLLLFFLLPAPFAFAQEPEKWQRLMTLEDSSVDINVSTVVFNTKGSARVQFRFLLSKAQSVPEMPGAKYKSFIETIEFHCDQSLYRLYEITYFDDKGNAIRTDEKDVSAKWKPLDGKGFIDKLYGPACQLIYDKKKNP
jgi:hypothetical protein